VKSPKIIVVLLVGNLALFAGIFSYVLRSRIASPISPGDDGAHFAAQTESQTNEPVLFEKLVVVTNELKWAQLESEDYKTYVARLRSIGCPEQTIRDIIIADLDKLLAALKKRALEHKDTVCIGRSHGIHAEPVIFGLKMAQAHAEFDRARTRMVAARAEIATCAISGAVGTFANIDPRSRRMLPGRWASPSSRSRPR
jgi:hypothetical protein